MSKVYQFGMFVVFSHAFATGITDTRTGGRVELIGGAPRDSLRHAVKRARRLDRLDIAAQMSGRDHEFAALVHRARDWHAGQLTWEIRKVSTGRSRVLLKEAD